MKWIKLDINNLPNNKKVLAANFTKKTYGYKDKLYGYVYKDSNDTIMCSSTNDFTLYNCTQYIDIDKFDNLR